MNPIASRVSASAQAPRSAGPTVFAILLLLTYGCANFLDLVALDALGVVFVRDTVRTVTLAYLFAYFAHSLIVFNGAALIPLLGVAILVSLSIRDQSGGVNAIVETAKYVTIPFIGYAFATFHRGSLGRATVSYVVMGLLWITMAFFLDYLSAYSFLESMNISRYLLEVENYTQAELFHGFSVNHFRVDDLGYTWRFIGPTLSALATGYSVCFFVLLLWLYRSHCMGHSVGLLWLTLGVGGAAVAFLDMSTGATASMGVGFAGYLAVRLFPRVHYGALISAGTVVFFALIGLYGQKSDITHSSFDRHMLDFTLVFDILAEHPLGTGVKSTNFSLFNSNSSLESSVTDIYGGGAEAGLIELIQVFGFPGLLFISWAVVVMCHRFSKAKNAEGFAVLCYIIATALFHKAPLSFIPGFLFWAVCWVEFERSSALLKAQKNP